MICISYACLMLRVIWWGIDHPKQFTQRELKLKEYQKWDEKLFYNQGGTCKLPVASTTV